MGSVLYGEKEEMIVRLEEEEEEECKAFKTCVLTVHVRDDHDPMLWPI